MLVSACLLGQRVCYDGDHAQLADDVLLTQLRSKFTVIAICSEILGSLATPKPVAEIQQRSGGIEVVYCARQSVSAAFIKGAEQASIIAQQQQVTRALLKSKSPSCGRGLIYDRSFTSQLCQGDGITVQHLQALGIEVYHEGEIGLLLDDN